MSTLRLIVTLLLLIFTMTILGENDPAAVEKKSEEDTITSLKGQKQNSDPENLRARTSPWHLHGYPPYMAHSMAPLQPHLHPLWTNFPAALPKPTSAQAFRWRYPSRYPWHGQHDTSAMFNPLKSQDGFCNFDQTFLCWGISYCIKPKTICDGVYNCPNDFDEDTRLCVEGRRPSVESIVKLLTTESFVKTVILKTNKDDEDIAKVLKSAESLDEVRWKLSLSPEGLKNLRTVFQAVKDNKKLVSSPNVDANEMVKIKYLFKVLMASGLRMS